MLLAGEGEKRAAVIMTALLHSYKLHRLRLYFFGTSITLQSARCNLFSYSCFTAKTLHLHDHLHYLNIIIQYSVGLNFNWYLGFQVQLCFDFFRCEWQK